MFVVYLYILFFFLNLCAKDIRVDMVQQKITTLAGCSCLSYHAKVLRNYSENFAVSVSDDCH